MISEITMKMIQYSNGLHHDIHHFLKVWSYAKTIGELEHLDDETQLILEIAALMHDIACPLCRQKYGSTKAELQEKEGMVLGAEFLKDIQLSDTIKQRIIYLIGHHHSLDCIHGLDYQILIEADYLVNADEASYSHSEIEHFMNSYFKTKTGIQLLQANYFSQS